MTRLLHQLPTPSPISVIFTGSLRARRSLTGPGRRRGPCSPCLANTLKVKAHRCFPPYPRPPSPFCPPTVGLSGLVPVEQAPDLQRPRVALVRAGQCHAGLTTVGELSGEGREGGLGFQPVHPFTHPTAAAQGSGPGEQGQGRLAKGQQRSICRCQSLSCQQPRSQEERYRKQWELQGGVGGQRHSRGGAGR